MRSPGIRAFGVSRGEIARSPADVARACGATEAALLRSLGARQVFATAGSAVTLALDAARACLRSAAAEPGELDAVIWFGDQPSGLRFQHELGTTRAFPIFLDGYCAEMLTGLRIACDLVRSGLGHVLVASGDRFTHPYTTRPPTEATFSDITSDGGAALLVSAEGAIVPLGFGFAARAEDWEYWPKHHQFLEGRLPVEHLPEPIDVMYKEIQLRREALAACLGASGVELDQIDRASISERVRQPALSVARQLRLSADRLVCAPYGHMGRSDVVHDLALMDAASTRTGLLLTGTPGIARCAVVQWQRP